MLEVNFDKVGLIKEHHRLQVKMRFCLLLLCLILSVCEATASDRSVSKQLLRKKLLQDQQLLLAPNEQPFNEQPPPEESKRAEEATRSEESATSSEEPETTKSDAKQTTKESHNNKSHEIDIAAIRPEIEKYRILDQTQYGELCSDDLLTKSPIQTLHLSGKHFVLILDEYNLTFKFELEEINKYYPKLSKIPYRCTSFCELRQKHQNKTDFTINRFKYNNYLIEFLNIKDYSLVKLYLENVKNLEDEDQSKHLVEALTFTIEADGCTSPVNNPALRDNYVDNLVTKDLIKTFCNKQLREQFKTNIEFLIQEREEPSDEIFKARHIVFFNYPVVAAYNLSNEGGKDAELQKSNLHNPIKDIRNAVQIRFKDQSDQRERFITFTDKQMVVLQRQETQLIEHPPSYAQQNYYTCPEPLCIDPYFDDLFMIKTCDFDLLFDFLPRASRLFMAFRGRYFYLLSGSGQAAPKINQAIPIDYLFKEVLGRPDIDFNHIDAAEYVKKSEVVILFREDKYLLFDPLQKIVNGPFDISETFKYAQASPETAFMDGDHLVLIQNGYALRYVWSAPLLTGKRDFSLVEYISLHSQHENKAIEGGVIDAAYKDGNSVFFFVDDYLAELNYNLDGERRVQIKDAKEFFNNCQSASKKIAGRRSKQPVLEILFNDINMANRAINGSEGNHTTTPAAKQANTTNAGLSNYVHQCYSIQMMVLVFLFMNLFRSD